LNASQPKAAALTFETVYEQHFDFVWSMTRRFGVPPETMDDVVQEVFMVVHKKLHTLESPEALRSWLYGIVRRRASGHHRQSWTQKTTGGVGVEDMPDVDGMQSPADLAEQSDSVRTLWALLDSIDPPKREVFIMAELQELTCPEIAKALNIPLNTAYSRLRHAREAFEAALARQKAKRGAQ
jgi:RNA polymerase sigma-70 factor, ECF subfamily